MNRKTAILLSIAALLAVLAMAWKVNKDYAAFRNTSGTPSSFSGSEKPVKGDTLVEASTGDASILNPILAADSASVDIVNLVYNGLVKYDKNIILTGDLAESWSVSKDGLVITFNLRKGVKWQDGIEFTADDVEFTFKKLTAPETKSPYKSSYEVINRLEKTGRYSVKVYYSKPFAPALESWGMGILPKHLFENSDVNTSKYNYEPVGTGAYKFKTWNRVRDLRLEYNGEYFEGRPYLEKYIYRIIPDQSVQFMELKAGGIDLMGLTPDMYVKQTENSEFKARFSKYRYPAFQYVYLGLNNLSPFFSDKKVRLAVSTAIDKKEIINGVILGLGSEATGPFPNGSWAYNKNVKNSPCDLNVSGKLLSEAGWKDADGDGILEKAGKKFIFTLMTNQGNKQRETIAVMIQSQLKKLGIKVNISIVAWPVFINEYVDKKKFDAVVLGWNLGRDPDCYDIFHSSKTGEKEYNFVSYKNEEVDRLLIEGRETFDYAKRKKIYNRIHELIAGDVPYVFL
ncbi:MAG: peptide-binding protein, partial [Candidatus Firestonebacteria bacterium]